MLRDTFAVRYLQAGGEPEALRDILGQADVAAVKRYQRLSDQGIESEQQKEPAEDHLSKQRPAPQKRRRHRRRPSSAVTKETKTHTQQGAGWPDGSAGKESVPHAADDP